MPYVIPSDREKLNLLASIKKAGFLEMSFRTWELYEYPLLPATSRHVWTVKTSNQLEKPRYVVLAFQTSRKNQNLGDASRFDNCDITNIRLFLNSQYYPYSNLNLNINNNQYSVLYDMYSSFQQSYYGREPQPLLNKRDFISNAALYFIDCSMQNESLKTGAVDIRLEFEARNMFPANTSAYCLILHDRIVDYNPMTGDVRKRMSK
ncbi:hypothetical protein QAD02_023826 [Eretmocerus hayati]|uniref:Uncharacterized protein n=1 Tax=Eretmocerus hayati TaxID=131215 RepID=A0ACC2PZ42_9HYME|nr:hypothetical protein QAD02_023826 [Eretmocerus hayati]